MRRAKNARTLTVLIGLLLGPLLFAAGTDALSEQARVELERARSPDWLSAFGDELAHLQEETRVPSRIYDLVLAATGQQAFPDDPRESARLLVAAARQVDLALRRGVPLALLRAEIRQAWNASRGEPRGFALGIEQRARQAAARFGAGNLRAWDPAQIGRSDDSGGAQAQGPGGGSGKH
jgi:hypothetical protein